MDKFIVSARKYRPQAFDTVVGQAHITTTLKNAIKQNQLAHAFLFCGPRGVGKTTCARILAKTINCENLQADGEACDTCNSCKSFNDGASLNIHELDAASNNSVDDIRTLVEQVRFAPQAGKYKVYIVDEVHMLSASAFNAFLKTLEEPPSYAIFILATTEKHKIIPTILSRCQIFDFKRITTNDTVNHLQEIIDKESIKADKASLQVIAQKSEGCMRDALSILDKIVSFTNGEVNYTNTLEHLNILDHDYYFKILDSLQQQDLAAAMLLYDEINRKGFEGDLVLNGFAEFIRNILVCKDDKALQLLDVVEGMQEKYKSVAKTASLSYLVSALNILNDAEINFKMARNKRLHVELTIIKLNFLQQAIDLIPSDSGGIAKKKRVNDAIAVKFKQVPSIQIASITNEGKLYVQEEKKTTVSTASITNTSSSVVNESETIVAEKPTIKYPATNFSTNTSTVNTGVKKSLLEALREKAGDKYNVIEVKEAEPLTIEKLQPTWNAYIEILQQKGDKHSTIGTFKIAELNIVNDFTFTVSVNALTQQKFIEQEKVFLIDYIQTAFNNRAINFTILITETSMQQDVPIHLTLNSKERFERIAKQYPLVRELKERLKFNIEY
ncbi:MAG: DNA polymerase III subunit gamma/tau [Chitinophagaceae bacterium]